MTTMNLENKEETRTFKTRFSQSSLFLSSSAIGERIIRLIRTMILTRLLLPEYFGLMSFSMSIATAYEAFTEVGMRNCIVQSKDGDSYEFLNAAWWIESIRRLLIFLMAYFTAPTISRFMDRPELSLMIQIISFSILFRGLQSPKIHVLEKKLRYGTWVLIVRVSELIGSILTVLLSFVYHSPLILAIGFVSEFAFQCLLSYVLCPFIPSIRIDRKYLKYILTFASGMFGTPIIMAIIRQSDVFIIGKMLGMTILGGYSIALSLANIPYMLFNSVLGRLIIPIYSEKRDSLSELNDFVFRITQSTCLFGIPLVAFLIISSKSLMTLLYSNKYAEFSHIFSILCIYMLIRVFSIILSSLSYAFNKPELDRRAMLFRGIVLVACIYPMTHLFGLTGTVMNMILSLLIYYLYHLKLFTGFFAIKANDYIWVAWRGVLLGVIFVLSYIFLSRYPIVQQDNVLTISLGILLFIIIIGCYLLLELVRKKKITASMATYK